MAFVNGISDARGNALSTGTKVSTPAAMLWTHLPWTGEARQSARVLRGPGAATALDKSGRFNLLSRPRRPNGKPQPNSFNTEAGNTSMLDMHKFSEKKRAGGMASNRRRVAGRGRLRQHCMLLGEDPKRGRDDGVQPRAMPAPSAESLRGRPDASTPTLSADWRASVPKRSASCAVVEHARSKANVMRMAIGKPPSMRSTHTCTHEQV